MESLFIYLSFKKCTLMTGFVVQGHIYYIIIILYIDVLFFFFSFISINKKKKNRKWQCDEIPHKAS